MTTENSAKENHLYLGYIHLLGFTFNFIPNSHYKKLVVSWLASRCMDMRCFFRAHFRLNLWGHSLHMKGRSPVCVRMCLVRFAGETNPMPHKLQKWRLGLAANWWPDGSQPLVNFSAIRCALWNQNKVFFQVWGLFLSGIHAEDELLLCPVLLQDLCLKSHTWVEPTQGILLSSD